VLPGRLRAIALMIGAVAAFACMDGLLKFLSTRYPLIQVAALRGATSLPFTLLPVLLSGRLRDLVPRRWPMHLLRGALYVVTLGCYIYGVRALSLANVYAVFLAAPLLVAALSVPLLRERLDWRNWLAILVGLGGVLAILRPTAAGFASSAALIVLAGAICYALSAIAVRVLTRTDTTVSVVFWTVGLMTVFALAIAAPTWRTIEPGHWRWLLALGAFGATGQYLMTEAFRSAPPSVVVPFEYTSLLWGVALDAAFWHVMPTAHVVLGGAIVIATGLYIIWRERSRAGKMLASSTADAVRSQEEARS